MALQIRLVHALADRIMDLEPRPGGGPLVVGRAAEADIQIPSLNVSRKHALLHARATGWMLQDAGGGRGTFLNGKPVTGAVALKSGDVVTLGSDPTPVTLVIDPYGQAAGRRSEAEAAEVGAPSPAHRAAAGSGGSALPQPTAPRARPPAVRGVPRPVPRVAAAPVDEDPAAYQPVPAGELPPGTPYEPAADAASDLTADATTGDAGEATDADWMAPAAASPSGSRRRPPKKQPTSTGLIVATVLLTGLIIGGAAWMYVKRSGAQLAQEIPTSKPAAAKPKVGSMFAEADPRHVLGAPQAAGTETPMPVAADPPDTSGGPQYSAKLEMPAGLGKGVPVVAAPGTAPPADDDTAPKPVAAADRDWGRIEDAHNTSDPVTAVVIYEDYLRLFPTSPHVVEVKKYIDESLDQLWWRRIDDLIKKKESLQKDRLKKEAELAAETSPTFRKDLEAEKAAIDKEIAENDEQLKVMKYDLRDPPNLTDPAAIRLLQKGRDAEVFENWKKVVYNKIKLTRGAKVF